MLILAAVWVSGGFKREPRALCERAAERSMSPRAMSAPVSNIGLSGEVVGGSTRA
jgi:hypothetical protein